MNNTTIRPNFNVDAGGAYLYAGPDPGVGWSPRPLVVPFPAGPSEAEVRETIDLAGKLLAAGKRIGELQALLRQVLACGRRSIPKDVVKAVEEALRAGG